MAEPSKVEGLENQVKNLLVEKERIEHMLETARKSLAAAQEQVMLAAATKEFELPPMTKKQSVSLIKPMRRHLAAELSRRLILVLHPACVFPDGTLHPQCNIDIGLQDLIKKEGML